MIMIGITCPLLRALLTDFGISIIRYLNPKFEPRFRTYELVMTWSLQEVRRELIRLLTPHTIEKKKKGVS